MSVAIAGDEVVGAGRYVHVPESWLRTEREREGRTRERADRGGAAVRARGDRGARRRRAERGCTVSATTARAALVLAITFGRGRRRDRGDVADVRDEAQDDRAGRMAGAPARVRARCWRRRSARSSLRLRRASACGPRGRARRTPLAGRLPPWAGGAAAALAVAGARRFAERLVPPEAPLWPSLPFEAAALAVGGGRAARGRGPFVDRRWAVRAAHPRSRDRRLDAARVACGRGRRRADRRAGCGERRRELGTAIAGGLVAGAIAAAVVYCVLRFDARTVPGYVVAAALVSGAENAALDGTAAGWIAFAVFAAVALAMGVGGRPLHRLEGPAAGEPSPAGAAAT